MPEIEPDYESKYYYGRPASMDELVHLIRNRLWREGKSMRYWLKKIREYRDLAWDMERARDKELAYVYAFKAAVLIFDKMPKLEDFRDLLDPQQKNNLAEHGYQLIELINTLTPQLRREYDLWVEEERIKAEAERIKVEAVEAFRRVVNRVAHEHAEDSAETQSTSNLEVETEKQRIMRLASADLSRPGSPVPPGATLPSELLSGPPPASPRSASHHSPDLKDTETGFEADYEPQESHWAGGRLPSYEEVMAEVLNEAPPATLSCTPLEVERGPSPEYREENGSDYNFQVVEPDHTSRAVTPQTPQYAELDEKNESPIQISPSLSRRSSFSQDSYRTAFSRPMSPAPERTLTSTTAPAQSADSQNFEALEKMLDDAYDHLVFFHSSGTQLPGTIRKKISVLAQFLV